jgi:hypothetical protein
MRASFFFASAAVAALVGACHHPPAGQTASPDAALAAAGPTLSGWLDGGGDGAAGDAGDAGRSAGEAFCDDVYAADTGQLIQKCPAKEQTMARGLARAASTVCKDDLKTALGRGRASFDPDAARHCVEMITASDRPRSGMTDTLFAHSPCDRVLLGMQPSGQPCRFSVECAEGLACVGYAPGTDGVCKAPPKVGDACTAQRLGSILNEEAAQLHHPACAAGAWCAGQKCEPRAKKAEPCASSAGCASGLSCVMGKCGDPGAAGQACFGTTDCAAGTWCDHPAATPGGHCEAKRRVGADCPQADACLGRCLMPRPTPDAGPPVGKCVDVCGSG